VSQAERVEVSDEVFAKARSRYPVDDSASGIPTMNHFQRGPLAAAKEYFSRFFEEALTESPGSPVRYYMTVSTFFPVLGFYAARVGDCIEILDFIEDEDYEDLIEDDPDD
jgi:hypothetical protein